MAEAVDPTADGREPERLTATEQVELATRTAMITHYQSLLAIVQNERNHYVAALLVAHGLEPSGRYEISNETGEITELTEGPEGGGQN